MGLQGWELVAVVNQRMHMPEISVVIATRDRAGSLDETLASLTRMVSPGVAWELLIVDNGSGSDSRAIIEKYTATLPIRYFHEPEPGMNRARNRGLRAARGELLVFTDDDVRVSESWLRKIWHGVLRWPEYNVFGGRIEPSLPPGTPAWMASRDFFFRGYAFAAYHLAEGEGPVSSPPCGPNFAVRRSLIRERLFDPDIGPNGSSIYPMGAETEYLLWAKRAGHRFVYLPEAVVEHVITEAQTRKSHLLQRAFNAGRAWEVLNFDLEVSGRAKVIPIGKLRRDMWRYRVKCLMRPFWKVERCFRNEVKLKMIQGRICERNRVGTGSTQVMQ